MPKTQLKDTDTSNTMSSSLMFCTSWSWSTDFLFSKYPALVIPVDCPQTSSSREQRVVRKHVVRLSHLDSHTWRRWQTIGSATRVKHLLMRASIMRSAAPPPIPRVPFGAKLKVSLTTPSHPRDSLMAVRRFQSHTTERGWSWRKWRGGRANRCS